ncbi:hypothetical protein GALMADRAFT_148010 [Galerina marginata CBS 339.88]|uniref:Uncharacterized protein n=1 Tax=Galerina marginata (strain CBS 339.88) TaxID=685588 RepID=A0A067SER5_GALM3|nr:hypothetical protein GALMADRAFT_148010 [Galerina marginata CBS 339.88]
MYASFGANWDGSHRRQSLDVGDAMIMEMNEVITMHNLRPKRERYWKHGTIDKPFRNRDEKKFEKLPVHILKLQSSSLFHASTVSFRLTSFELLDNAIYALQSSAQMPTEMDGSNRAGRRKHGNHLCSLSRSQSEADKGYKIPSSRDFENHPGFPCFHNLVSFTTAHDLFLTLIRLPTHLVSQKYTPDTAASASASDLQSGANPSQHDICRHR